MKATAKSDFGGLVKYITSAQGRDERVGVVTITNCNGLTPEDAAQDVMLVQAANQRAAADKTYHLIISFPPGEIPSAAALRDIEETICAGLGFAEHQRISAVHHDTDHTHIHLAINKIHPTRHTIQTPLRDYRTLADLCERLEIRHGLERVNHTAHQRGGGPCEGHGADRRHREPDRLGAANLLRTVEGRHQLGRASRDRGQLRSISTGARQWACVRGERWHRHQGQFDSARPVKTRLGKAIGSLFRA
jgi:hypothetical protein